MVWAFLPIHLRSLNASFSLIALASLLPALETIVLSPLWGGLLDSTRRSREIILGAVLAQALEFTLFPFLATPEQFVVAVSLVGVFTSSFIPVYSAIATRDVPALRPFNRRILGGRLPRVRLGHFTGWNSLRAV